MEDLKNQVLHIKETIENGITFDDCGIDADEYGRESTDIISGYDYLEDILDINYIVDGNGEYIGARILVAFGGPNIWIDTQQKRIDGYWWQDKFSSYYNDDEMDIDGTLEELWGCR
jgi:hypothetical protein